MRNTVQNNDSQKVPYIASFTETKDRSEIFRLCDHKEGLKGPLQKIEQRAELTP